MSPKSIQPIRPLLLLFVMMSAFFITGKKWLIQKGIQPEVVIIGNLVLFLVSLAAYFVTQRALSNTNSHAFVRSVNTSFILKFFAIAVAAFIYIYISREDINKPGLLLCGVLYFLYTGIETVALMKAMKKNKNA